jgi:hypothetical protein
MKAILAAVVVIGLVGFVQAEDKDKKADPTGTWKCEYEIGGMKRMSTLTLKLQGDKLTGTMTFMDGMKSEIKDGKFKDGQATFSAEREVQEQKITINYKVKVEGDTFKGKAEADFGGQTQSFDFEGKREKK